MSSINSCKNCKEADLIEDENGFLVCPNCAIQDSGTNVSEEPDWYNYEDDSRDFSRVHVPRIDNNLETFETEPISKYRVDTDPVAKKLLKLADDVVRLGHALKIPESRIKKGKEAALSLRVLWERGEEKRITYKLLAAAIIFLVCPSGTCSVSPTQIAETADVSLKSLHRYVKLLAEVYDPNDIDTSVEGLIRAYATQLKVPENIVKKTVTIYNNNKDSFENKKNTSVAAGCLMFTMKSFRLDTKRLPDVSTVSTKTMREVVKLIK